MVYFGKIVQPYTFSYFLDTGMQNGNEALPSIHPAYLVI